MTVDVLDAPPTLDVAAMMDGAGLTYRVLDYWTRCGYLREIPRERAGSGFRRRWPMSELAVAAMMARLTAVKIDPSTAAAVARAGGTLDFPNGVSISVTLEGP